MPRRVEQVVFVVHGIVTIAAAIVLVVAPAAIPATVGIALRPEGYLLSYFLAAAELAIGLLSIGTAWIQDRGAVRLVAGSFAVFHAATAVLEGVHLATQGYSVVLLVNVIVRVIVCGVFLVIAVRR